MNLIPLPYRILGALAGAAMLFFFGYWKGDHDASASYELKIGKTREATQKIMDAEAAIANTAATKLETGNAQSRIIYKTITQTVDRIVERPVYSGACLDDDGLRLINDALAGPASPSAAKPADAVPSTGAPH